MHFSLSSIFNENNTDGNQIIDIQTLIQSYAYCEQNAVCSVFYCIFDMYNYDIVISF